MAKVLISTQEVNSAGEKIIEQSAVMYRRLEEIRSIIAATKDSFESEAGQSFRRNFEQTASEFEKFKQFINAYGEFLKNYSAGHVELDQAIDELAASFMIL